MIAKAERREAARQFKERKPSTGIYALRCSTTGRSWVDSSPNLDAAQNGQFFQLRQRLHRNKELQAEWNTQGEESFRFEVLEALPEDTPALNLHDILAERK
ncbi:MAG: GIY-YIG nuclease family protein, partial [Edaphobacter sp.]